MFEIILGTMAELLAAADRKRRDRDDALHAGPFSKEEYEDNAVAGASWETLLAVRKAHTRLKQGRADEALTLLVNCRQRLPANEETKRLDHLILQLREVQGK